MAIKPLLRGLWQRLLAGGAARPATNTRVYLQAADSHSLYLKRGSWLVAQQGSCTISLPLQWQAERIAQRQLVLHEGDAWQVPESAHYQLRHHTASQVAARGIAIETSRVLLCQAP